MGCVMYEAGAGKRRSLFGNENNDITRPRARSAALLVVLAATLLVGRQFATPARVAAAMREAPQLAIPSSAVTNVEWNVHNDNSALESDHSSVSFTSSAAKNNGPGETIAVQATDIRPTKRNNDYTNEHDQRDEGIDDNINTNDKLDELGKGNNKKKNPNNHEDTNHAEIISVDNDQQDGVADEYKWRLPPPLTHLEPAPRGSAISGELIAHPWTQPRVLSSYIRPVTPSHPLGDAPYSLSSSRTFDNSTFRFHQNESSSDYNNSASAEDTKTEVFIYATGVTMGNFDQRNLSLCGCLVGRDVYRLQYYALDVFLCVVPRVVRGGEYISIVLRNDDNLVAALAGPVDLGEGFEVTLKDGVDILPLPTDALIHLPSSASTTHTSSSKPAFDLPNYRQIRSRHVTSSVEEPAKLNVAERPRYEICAVTMMKQFDNLLEDWIDYHRRIGVDHIILLDNAATSDLPRRYADRPDIEVVNWPFQRSQVQGMSLITVATRSRCEWLLMCDADEYVMLGLGKKHEYAGQQSLKRLLEIRRREHYDDVRFQYITMGPSGNVRIPQIPVPEAYTAKYESQKENWKSASLTDRDWIVSKIHFLKGIFTPQTYWPSRDVNFFPVTQEDEPALVHYQFRSLEEAILKKKFGSSSIGDRNLHDNVPEMRRLDRPSELYTQVPDNLRYTHFRDIWRAVSKATTVKGRTLVRWHGESRCSVVFDDANASWSDEVCGG